MNTNDTLHFDRVQLARFIEVALYAGLAAVLIGWIFSHQGFVTFREASLVMLGTVFGLMASCGGAPLSSLLLRGNTGRQASGEALCCRSASAGLTARPRRSTTSRAAPRNPAEEPRACAARGSSH